ncbi:14546_t:CDS:2, partial [Acaulospora colombiana]
YGSLSETVDGHHVLSADHPHLHHPHLVTITPTIITFYIHFVIAGGGVESNELLQRESASNPLPRMITVY